MTSNKRLNSKRYGSGGDYDLVAMADDHYYDLQKDIGKTLKILLRGCKKERFSVLELGTGSGMTLEQIEKTSCKFKITSVDNDQSMIETAKSKLGEKDIKFVNSDILEYLKRTEECFDVVISGCTFHNWELDYQLKVFEEIFNKIRSGGFLINADKIAKDSPKEHLEDFKLDLEKLNVFKNIHRPDLTNMWKKHYLEDEDRKVTQTEYKRVLHKLGFQDIQFYDRYGLNIITSAKKK